MLGLQSGGIGAVRLEGTEVPDRGRETCALHEMPRGMPITARSGLGEREDHRPKQERRGERVLAGQDIRRWRQDLVMVAIELSGPRHHEARGSIHSRPGDEERQCL